jgi:phosphoribosylaminoimidazolecarboxamide formyltransferase/IMP cyclohydrolase
MQTMNEFQLKYGTNPNQKPARIFMKDGGDLPVTVLNGRPGYINFLDALNSWQLVRDLQKSLQLPAAASFKHVSPAGAALGLPLDDVLRQMYHVDPKAELSPLACAYARARGTDRMSSFGDWIALSQPCDHSTALLIQHEVSDGIIAPGYDADALAILKAKKKGAYNVVAVDPAYVPDPLEQRTVFGVTFEQGRQDLEINAQTMLADIVTRHHELSAEQKRDLVLSLIVLKYTQSNSVCYVQDGQTIGVGAGQQSRIHCTRLAGRKADLWQLRHMPQVLELPFLDSVKRQDRDNAIDVYLGDTPEDVIGEGVWQSRFAKQPEPLDEAVRRSWLAGVHGVSLGSDAFFPFEDNIERARRSGVSAIVQPGGSIRDDQVIAACDRCGIVMAFCHIRLFHH